jgi:uncharacterized protein (TIGR02246 family)
MSAPMPHSAFILASFAAIAGPALAVAQGTPADTQAIQDLIQAHAVAWNHHDAAAAAAIMTPDAVWITSSGATLRGRAQIEQAHRHWLAEDSATGGSTHAHPRESVRIQFLRPDVAVADLASEFVANPKPGKPPATPERGFLFIVVMKGAGGWHIAEVRNTLAPRS